MKPGTKLKSAVCSAEVMIIKMLTDGELTCGGVPMGEEPDDGDAVAAYMSGCVIGKRYVDSESLVEILCVASGDGSLAVNGVELSVKEANRLPASD